MKKIKTLVFTFLLLFFSANLVQAMSLDEIYRDVVRSDNRGYLPMFVKNRTAPDFLDEEVVLKDVPELNPDLEIVKLENQRKIHEAKLRAELAEWQAVLDNVRAGKVTPVELRALELKAEQSDPQAVEILGWIYARGVGVKPDLIKSFKFYQKAADIGVPDASLNAAKVYKIMPRRLREQLISYQ
mgnify:CR=1 FL=1